MIKISNSAAEDKITRRAHELFASELDIGNMVRESTFFAFNLMALTLGVGGGGVASKDFCSAF